MGLCARRRLREEGEPHPDGEAGDLRFRLRQEPHPRFRREDDDLHFDLPITLTEALVGFSKAIRHLDGHWVEVTESGERAGCRGTPLSSRAAAATSSAARHGQASRRAATPGTGCDPTTNERGTLTPRARRRRDEARRGARRGGRRYAHS